MERTLKTSQVPIYCISDLESPRRQDFAFLHIIYLLYNIYDGLGVVKPIASSLCTISDFLKNDTQAFYYRGGK